MTDQRGLSFIDAVKELADAAGMQVPAADPKAAERAERANSLYDVMKAAADWFADQLAGIDGAEARNYLDKRGLTSATVKAFGMGYAPDSKAKLKTALARFGEDKLIESGLLIKVDDKESYDRFRGRLMIPILDARGRVIAFGGRILGAGEPKYLNSPDTPLFDKGRTLYNIDKAGPESRKTGRIIVVEGYMDVIALAQSGIGDAVAPLGTALTEHQLERLWRMADFPILCFDGDSAGQKASIRAAMKALPDLIPGRAVRFVSLPNGLDPDDLIQNFGVGRLHELLALPEDLSNLLWRHFEALHNLTSADGRAAFRSSLDSVASEVKNPIVSSEYRAAFRDRFFSLYRLSRDQRGLLRKDMANYRHGPARTLSTLESVIVRAILLGLMRYSELINEMAEQILDLEIADERLKRWRNRLVEIAHYVPNLDEDIIDTILSDEMVPEIEKRDLRKDLAFSFYYRANERAVDDLRKVISVCRQEQEIRNNLALARSRFKKTADPCDWDEQKRLQEEASKLEKIRLDFADELRAAA